MRMLDDLPVVILRGVLLFSKTCYLSAPSPLMRRFGRYGIVRCSITDLA